MSGITLGSEFTPLLFEQVTVTTTAYLLTTLATKPDKARHMMLYPEEAVRFRCDGSNPTDDVGIILDPDLHVFENQLSMIDSMILISDTGGNVTVNVHWFA